MLFRVALLFLISMPILVGYLWMFISTFAVRTHGLMPVAAQAEGGNIKILSAPWTDDLLAELEEFPGGWDDQVDALAGAFTDLVGSTSLVMWSA